MTDRKLASVREIRALEPIEGADRIELAFVDGWQVVVQKGLYEPGEKCVYFEVDSVLPDKPWCSFMKDRKFRVRTIKLRKTLSQGLCIPLEECGLPQALSVGTDVTKMLGVKKYEKYKSANPQFVGSKQEPKWYSFLLPKARDKFPSFLQKSDEPRVQNLAPSSYVGESYTVTEKLDGCSATYCYLPFRPLVVASRNVWLKKRDESVWWRMADGLGLRQRMKKMGLRNVAIQGEIIGPAIQGNPYKVDMPHFYMYAAYRKHGARYIRLDYHQMREIAMVLGIPTVPLLHLHLPGNVNWVANVAVGNSKVNEDVLREGVVAQDTMIPTHTFKAINNDYLLKHE